MGAYATYRASKHFGSLDGLRCLSILAVIWHHAADTHSGFASMGYLGVVLFFVISGYLITTLLLREQDECGQISLYQFYARRTLRIFPLYYAVLAVYVALTLFVERDGVARSQFFDHLPAFLTYTSNWFVELDTGGRVIFYFVWSLATEEQFYLFWPGVVRFAPARWLAATAIAALASVDTLLERFIANGLLSDAFLPLRIITSISTPICLGCLLAFALHHQASFERLYRLVATRWFAPAALIALGIAVATNAPFLVIVAVMLCLVAAVCVKPTNGLTPLLANRVVRHIGMVSYGMYLMHMLALNGARRIAPGQSGLMYFILATALSIGAATLSYQYFERPFLRLKERFRGTGGSDAATATLAKPT
jgi:peptidoglycan/LPS O-acetylase OafA/YrhL